MPRRSSSLFRNLSCFAFILIGATRAFANIGVGTLNPAAGLDVATTGSASAIVVPRDNTTNRPSTAVNGMIRYNTSANAFEGYVNGAWMQFAQQPVGSTANVTASGPPVGAGVYAPASTTCNFSPGYGTCAQVTNGNWPANGTASNQGGSCTNLPPDGSASIVLDFGSNKTFGNVYASLEDPTQYMILAVSFSVDNVTYTSNLSLGSNVGYYSTRYVSAVITPSQVARYVRLTNAAGTTSVALNSLCQFAVGP